MLGKWNQYNFIAPRYTDHRCTGLLAKVVLLIDGVHFVVVHYSKGWQTTGNIAICVGVSELCEAHRGSRIMKPAMTNVSSNLSYVPCLNICNFRATLGNA